MKLQHIKICGMKLNQPLEGNLSIKFFITNEVLKLIIFHLRSQKKNKITTKQGEGQKWQRTGINEGEHKKATEKINNPNAVFLGGKKQKPHNKIDNPLARMTKEKKTEAVLEMKQDYQHKTQRHEKD